MGGVSKGGGASGCGLGYKGSGRHDIDYGRKCEGFGGGIDRSTSIPTLIGYVVALLARALGSGGCKALLFFDQSWQEI